jgi:uncharacterized protein YdaU (DUF1376 family)
LPRGVILIKEMEFDMIIDENSKPREKLKAWYLFTDDFIAGTQHLTNLEVGIYIRLLCWNWNKKCVGIPSDNITYYRIASCHTHNEKEACDNVLREFFILMETNKYQNAKQLEEYLFITRRMEASRENGRLGGRPKKPSQNPPTTTTTNTTKQTKINYSPHFLKFWEKVVNKVSKGIAEKNYVKLDEEWLEKPIELATMYNNYYNSIEDKQFAKQPAFWLSAKKYLDENPKKESTQKVEQFDMRLKVFKEAIQKKEGSAFVHKFAKQHSYDVERAIKEGHFTKDEAVKYLDMGSWV